MFRIKIVHFTIDTPTLSKYETVYFAKHPRAKKVPIPYPYHESINKWMIMKRPMMNALKQRWKDFMVWLVDDLGFADLNIQKCEISQKIFFPTNRRHDCDNTVPKFILDGLVEGRMIVDDDSTHITKLTLQCGIDEDHPRTEFTIHIFDDEFKED